MSDNFKLVVKGGVKPFVGLFNTNKFSKIHGTVYATVPDDEVKIKLKDMHLKPSFLSRLRDCDIHPDADFRIEWKFYRTIATLEIDFEIWGDPTKFTLYILKYGKIDLAFAELLDVEFYNQRLKHHVV